MSELIPGSILTVRRRAKTYGTVIDGNVTISIKQGRKPAKFQPGWVPLEIYTGFAPVFILELRHETGRRSTWYLDGTLNLLSLAPENLKPPTIEILRERAERIWAEMTDAVERPRTGQQPLQATISDPAQGFFRLNVATRLAIMEASKPRAARPPLIDLSEVRDEAFLAPVPRGGAVAIRRSHLLLPFEEGLHQTYIRALEAGEVTFGSIVDGEPLHTDQCLCFDDFRFAFRVEDQRYGLVFFVICTQHDCKVTGIYVPTLGQEFNSGGMTRHWYQTYFPTGFADALLNHLCRHGDALSNYLDQPTRELVVFNRFTHLGHDLHNELAGLYRLVTTVERHAIPEVIAFRADLGSELYGRTEDIIPEVAGKVRRDIGTHLELIQYTYEHMKCPLHVTDAFVPNGLRERILRANLSSDALAGDRERLKQFRDDRLPIVLIGLRVENRTLVDLPEFCCRLTEFVLETTGGCVIVVDGHVALNEEVGGKVFNSHWEDRASLSPVEAEGQIVDLLERRFSARNVVIIDNIGAPMRRALYWCVNSQFFVAVGGTGLAKYRWVCNKPGLIISNRAGLAKGSGIYIYEPPIMEECTPVRYLSAEFVTDMPDAPTLVPFESGGYSAFFHNFHVDDRAVFAEVKELLRENPPSGEEFSY